MRLWLLMFGGMLIWALHFGGVYLIASIFDLVSRSSAAASFWSITAWTLACVGANIALLVAVLAQWRQGGADPVRAFMLSGKGGASVCRARLLSPSSLESAG
jgi:hypothetical protein